MKVKKFLSAILVGAMVLSIMMFTAFAEETGTVAKIGDNEYATLKEAFEALNGLGVGDYTLTIFDGTYQAAEIMINQMVGKTLTIKAQNQNCVTIQFDTSVISSQGGQTYSIFRINGASSYSTGPVTFDGINFDFSTVDDDVTNWFYAIYFGSDEHRYANDITIKNCTFIGNEGEGSFVAGSSNGSSPTAITFDNCDSNKCVELYNGYINGANGFGLKILNCTVDDAYYLANITGGQGANTIKNTTVNFSSGFGFRHHGGGLIVEDSTFNYLGEPYEGTDPAYLIAMINVHKNYSGVSDITVKNTVFNKGDKVGVYDIIARNDSQNTVVNGVKIPNNVGFNFPVKIGNDVYVSLASAIEAAREYDIITLLDDIELSAGLTIAANKIITLDLNGKNISYVSDVAGTSALITNNGNLTITDSVGNGKIINSALYPDQQPIPRYANNTITNRGTLTINGGIIENTTNVSGGFHVPIDNNSTDRNTFLTINGGKIIHTNNYMAIRLYANSTIYRNVITINGGEIIGSRVIWIHLPDPSGPGKLAELVINGGTLTSTDSINNRVIYSYSFGESFANTHIIINDGVFNGNVVFTAGENKVTTENVNIYGGTFNGANSVYSYGEMANIIHGGTYASDVTKYCIPGYHAVQNQEGMYEIVKVSASVIDSAKSSGMQVKLDNLEKNDAIDRNEEATYQLVINSISVEDKESLSGTVGSSSKTVIAFDFSVQKIVDGKSEEVPVRNQRVTIILPTPVTDKNSIKIYHIKNGVVDRVVIEGDDITIADDNRTISFIAPEFSVYAVAYDAPALADSNITKNMEIVFEQVAGKTDEYDIVLKATDAGKYINGLLSADLTFALNSATPVNYIIEGAANVNVIDYGNGRFAFNYDGIGASSATGDAINIGKVKFEGYCANAVFTVVNVPTNIVNTTKAADGIVDKYDVNGDGITTGLLSLGTGIPNLTIETIKKNLTIVIDFPNAITDQIKDYQDMEVTITGSGITPIVTKLGTNGVALVNGKYTVNINDTLSKDFTYTVTVSGAGYRTVRYNVTMTSDKVLTFWNNVKDNAVNVEEGNNASARKVTFLAGDIVKDNQINLYDLSAVVSYFGMIDLSSDVSTYKYAKYDLNRDGKIDSKDVAYVLVSWGN